MTEKQTYTYSWPRPMVTVDTVVFSRRAGGPGVLLIRRGRPPFEGHWALPGGFVEEHEPLDAAAARELREETGLEGVTLRQFHTFGDPGRDPRGHTISVAYWGEAPADAAVLGADDASEAVWFPLDMLPPLAFDHKKIVEYSLVFFGEDTPKCG